ncbi:M15 family metallopeptidase [Nocardioides zeae]|uniref:M15 family metallopeptidase n=1 Tax=Nocardioides imazamoxiresistens TaxID=3231893 RepID=A0ABU3PVZ7_9ACTN|nr:M15 family metallopeptidase [Nocardioides zeae]MDT9593405.1 M15 family metallopeptidase [Nocardioides zeae]
MDRRRPPRRVLGVAGLVVAAVLAGCSGTPGASDPAETPGGSTTTASPGVPAPTATTTATPEPTPEPEPGTVAPPWLGTRPLPARADGTAAPQPTPTELDPRRLTSPDALPALPGDGYASEVTAPAPADVVERSTWREGCPVAARDLAWVRVAFVGFDDARHTGELLVATDVADDLVEVFAALYAARFPIEEMRVTTAAELDAEPTGDGNNTESFVCRATTGGGRFSQHAYGTALDVNPFQNPYDKGTGSARVVIPELATSYTDRGVVRPGMVLADDAVVDAFAAIGWEWGGAWQRSKDYQHFSRNGL